MMRGPMAIHPVTSAAPAPAQAIFADLARLFGTRPGQAAILPGAVAQAWRSLLGERLEPGETVLVPIFGPASRQLAAVAEALGLIVETVEGSLGTVPYGALCRRLRDDVEGRIRAVLLPATDGAGVRADVGAVRALLERAYHEALLLVDVTGALAADTFQMDAWGVDVAVADGRLAPGLADGLALVAVADGPPYASAAGSLRLVAAE